MIYTFTYEWFNIAILPALAAATKVQTIPNDNILLVLLEIIKEKNLALINCDFKMDFRSVNVFR